MKEKEVFFIASLHSNKKNKDLLDSNGLLKLNLRRNLDYIILDSTAWNQVKEEYDINLPVKNDVYQVFITFSCQGISFKTLYIHGVEKVFDVIQTLFVNKTFGLEAFVNMFEVKMSTVDSMDTLRYSQISKANECIQRNTEEEVLYQLDHFRSFDHVSDNNADIKIGSNNKYNTDTIVKIAENTKSSGNLPHKKDFVLQTYDLKSFEPKKDTMIENQSERDERINHLEKDFKDESSFFIQSRKSLVYNKLFDVSDQTLFNENQSVYSSAKVIDPYHSFNSLASPDKKIILFVERKKPFTGSLESETVILESNPAFEIKPETFSDLKINSKPKNMSLPNINEIDKIQDSLLEIEKNDSKNCEISQIKNIPVLDLSSAETSLLSSQIYLQENLQHLDLQKPSMLEQSEVSQKESLNISGIINLGNTCYINTSLQCLYSCSYFINSLFQNPSSNYNDGSFVCTMIDFFKEMKTKALVSPVNIKRSIALKNPSFNNSDEQDAEEFISTLLDNLHEELKETVDETEKPYRNNDANHSISGKKTSRCQSTLVCNILANKARSIYDSGKKSDMSQRYSTVDQLEVKSNAKYSDNSDKVTAFASYEDSYIDHRINNTVGKSSNTGEKRLGKSNDVKSNSENNLTFHPYNTQNKHLLPSFSVTSNEENINDSNLCLSHKNPNCKHSLSRGTLTLDAKLAESIEESLVGSKKMESFREIVSNSENYSKPDEKVTINAEVKENAFFKLLDYKRSMISDLFYGMITSTLMCSNCKFKKTKDEIINNLSLSIPNKIVYHCSSFFVGKNDGIFNKILVPLSFTIQEAKNYIAFESGVDYPQKSNIIALKYDKNFPVLQLKDEVSVSSVLNTIVFYEVENIGTMANLQKDYIFVRFFFKKLIFFTRKFSLDLVINAESLNSINQKSKQKHQSNNKGIDHVLRTKNFNQDLVIYVLKRLQPFLQKNIDIDQLMKYLYVKDISFDNEIGMNTIDIIINDQKSLFGTSLAEFDCIKPFKKNDITISDCLNDYFKDEEVDLKCDCCKKDSKYIKRSAITRFPTYLVVQFKRFRFHGSGTKINTFVDFPLERLKIKDSAGKDVFYRLMSSANHIEIGLGYGHYMAFVRREGSWYCCNDSVITKTLGVDKSSSYILFYELVK